MTTMKKVYTKKVYKRKPPPVPLLPGETPTALQTCEARANRRMSDWLEDAKGKDPEKFEELRRVAAREKR